MATQLQPGNRVGLDAHLLTLAQGYRGAGIKGYISELLAHLPAAGRELRYTAYLHEPGYVPPAGLAVRRSRRDTRGPWRRIAWEQTSLALLSREQDVLHGLAYAVPLLAACQTIVTVHDLSFIRYPAAFRPFNRHYLSWMTRAAARRATRVITVSESTRRDVIELCGVPAERVVAIPNGIGEEFCLATPAEVAEFRRDRGLPERFILYLGTIEPRKNLVRLIEAYAGWQTARASIVKLIIAGGKGWYYEQVFRRVAELGLEDRVIFPGYVPAGELPWWYRAAMIFVYPSFYEGFGLPVLEAMACGTPVITTTASSLPEVAGDAAVLVDPQDTAAFTAAMDALATDAGRVSALRAAGIERAASFSWARTAAATAQLHREVLGGAR